MGGAWQRDVGVAQSSDGDCHSDQSEKSSGVVTSCGRADGEDERGTRTERQHRGRSRDFGKRRSDICQEAEVKPMRQKKRRLHRLGHTHASQSCKGSFVLLYDPTARASERHYAPPTPKIDASARKLVLDCPQKWP